MRFFLYLAICNDIKLDAVRSAVWVVEACEIIFFHSLSASILHKKEFNGFSD
jgi:hypothetical protein